MLNLFLKQIRDRIENDHKPQVDQRLENIVIALAYLAVELNDQCQVLYFRLHIYLIFVLFFFTKIRKNIVKVLLDFYQRLPTARYYEVASYNYKHGIETFLFNKLNKINRLSFEKDCRQRKYLVFVFIQL